eukprot:RCo048012
MTGRSEHMPALWRKLFPSQQRVGWETFWAAVSHALPMEAERRWRYALLSSSTSQRAGFEDAITPEHLEKFVDYFGENLLEADKELQRILDYPFFHGHLSFAEASNRLGQTSNPKAWFVIFTVMRGHYAVLQRSPGGKNDAQYVIAQTALEDESDSSTSCLSNPGVTYVAPRTSGIAHPSLQACIVAMGIALEDAHLRAKPLIAEGTCVTPQAEEEAEEDEKVEQEVDDEKVEEEVDDEEFHLLGVELGASEAVNAGENGEERGEENEPSAPSSPLPVELVDSSNVSPTTSAPPPEPSFSSSTPSSAATPGPPSNPVGETDPVSPPTAQEPPSDSTRDITDLINLDYFFPPSARSSAPTIPSSTAPAAIATEPVAPSSASTEPSPQHALARLNVAVASSSREGASSSLGLKERMHEELTCSICLELFRDPRKLSCDHTFCRRCLEALVGSGAQVRCPECRSFTRMCAPGPSGVSNLPVDRRVKRMVASIEPDPPGGSQVGEGQPLGGPPEELRERASSSQEERCGDFVHINQQEVLEQFSGFVPQQIGRQECSARFAEWKRSLWLPPIDFQQNSSGLLELTLTYVPFYCFSLTTATAYHATVLVSDPLKGKHNLHSTAEYPGNYSPPPPMDVSAALSGARPPGTGPGSTRGSPSCSSNAVVSSLRHVSAEEMARCRWRGHNTEEKWVKAAVGSSFSTSFRAAPPVSMHTARPLAMEPSRVWRALCGTTAGLL